jgi:hypothetical protein
VQARRTDGASAWQQLQLRAATGRVAWMHRFRLEQRWIGATMADGDVADWRYAKRVRYMVRTTAPFAGRRIDPGELFVAASLATAGHRRPPRRTPAGTRGDDGTDVRRRAL